MADYRTARRLLFRWRPSNMSPALPGYELDIPAGALVTPAHEPGQFFLSPRAFSAIRVNGEPWRREMFFTFDAEHYGVRIVAADVRADEPTEGQPC